MNILYARNTARNSRVGKVDGDVLCMWEAFHVSEISQISFTQRASDSYFAKGQKLDVITRGF